MTPDDLLLGDAMAGDGALFSREDAVEAAWAVVDPVLKTHHALYPYDLGSWGPKEATCSLPQSVVGIMLTAPAMMR